MITMIITVVRAGGQGVVIVLNIVVLHEEMTAVSVDNGGSVRTR